MVETLADVAQELSSRYGAIKNFLKKGEKSDVFLAILKRLFYEYGEYFGFEEDELSAFKSEVIQAKNNLKQKGKRVIKNVRNPRKYFRPKEGDGEIFTSWQVEAYGLNPDSY